MSVMVKQIENEKHPSKPSLGEHRTNIDLLSGRTVCGYCCGSYVVGSSFMYGAPPLGVNVVVNKDSNTVSPFGGMESATIQCGDDVLHLMLLTK